MLYLLQCHVDELLAWLNKNDFKYYTLEDKVYIKGRHRFVYINKKIKKRIIILQTFLTVKCIITNKINQLNSD